MENVPCNYCQSNDSIPIIKDLPDLLLNRSEPRSNFVQCLHCGLIYQNPRPSLEEMEKYYPKQYEDQVNIFLPENPSLATRLALRYGMRRRVATFAPFHAKGHLLDIGCGSGFFLESARKTGNWQVFGVETSPQAVKTARQVYGLDVIEGTLEDADFKAETFEVVTLWDVLEHMHDPSATLIEIHRILKPGGILVIRVPNASSRDRSHFGSAWAGWDAPRHLYIFSPHTLNQLLSMQKFKVKVQNSHSGAYPSYLLSLKFLWVQQGKMKSRQRLLQFLHSPLARLVSAPIFAMLSRNLKGPELSVVAAKMEYQR